MRYIFVMILVSFCGFSQTNEAVINQAVQTAKSQNITTKSQAVKALEASGMTENQARQLARQRGLSYDQLLNQYFTNDIDNKNSIFDDPDSKILEDKNEIKSEDEETLEKTDFRIKGQTLNYFGYNIVENNHYLNKE